MKDKKKIIISTISIILVLIILFTIIINKRADTVMRKKHKTLPEVELSEIFEADDINKLEGIEIEKTSNLSVSSKSMVGSNSYIVKADVKLKNRTGKLIFLRDGYNKSNIYQTKYGINELDSISTQVSRYMEEFKQNCIMLMGAVTDEPYSEVLYNESEEDKNIPLEESIFNNNKVYGLTYKLSENSLSGDTTTDLPSDTNKYEINFYRNGEYLMCEFVKIF